MGATHVVLLVLVAAAAELARAQPLFGCPLLEKGPVPVSEPVCSYSAGGLYMLCFPHAFADAPSACASHNLQFAAITESNLLYARDLISRCSYSGDAWIGSINGLAADPCLDFYRNRTTAPNNYTCLAEPRQVMCQALQVITASTTTTATTVTTRSGTKTVLTRTTDIHQKPDHSPDEMFIEKRAAAPEDARRPNGCSDCFNGSPLSSCNCCSNSCNVTVGGLHIVSVDPSIYSEAAALCCQHGWYLADYTSGMSGIVNRYLFPGCRGDAERLELWVRSFEGVDGFGCVGVTVDGVGVEAVFGYDAEYCNGTAEEEGAKRMVLCQEDMPMVTGYGPVTTHDTTSTIVYKTARTVTIPATTTTITSTITCLDRSTSTSHGPRFRRPRWIPTGAK